jgi:hypothetical protein
MWRCYECKKNKERYTRLQNRGTPLRISEIRCFVLKKIWQGKRVKDRNLDSKYWFFFWSRGTIQCGRENSRNERSNWTELNMRHCWKLAKPRVVNSLKKNCLIQNWPIFLYRNIYHLFSIRERIDHIQS